MRPVKLWFISFFRTYVFKELKRPNTLSISAELDSIGSEFNAFTGKECTGYYVKAARDKMPIILMF